MEVYFITVVLISGVTCFNIDVDNVVNFRGSPGIHFGYSAAMFSNEDGNKWVVVGATRANLTKYEHIKSPGDIYKCKLDFTRTAQDTCEPMNIKATDNYRFPQTPGYEEDNQLLGASMSIIDDKIITCAPLWKNMIPWNSVKFVHPIGRCFNIAKNLTTYNSKVFKSDKFKEYEPEDSNQLSYEIAQIGFSISNKKYNDTLLDILLGAPGFFENKGGFLQYSAEDSVDNFFDTFTQQALEDDQANSIKMGTLMGYSITTGKLVDSKCPSVVVLGAPHFLSTDGIVGSVLVVCAVASSLEKYMDVKKQFFGRRSGSGFGTSLIFDDVNNDGLDDLLVGAPLQYNRKTNVLDVGAVFIFYGVQDETVQLETSGQVLKGSKIQYGRFGTAMQCIGDVNIDGINDIVVGAPYEEDLKGAIYVYHGGDSWLTLAQRISASQVSSDLHSFGWYISTANDIDKNQYPDFVVGSYMSDTVSVFRSRPIIILDNSLGVNPTIVPLNSSGLQCQDDQYRPCVTLHICFIYSGINVPDKIMVAYNISVDILRTRATPSKSSRVHIYTEGVNNHTDLIQGQTVVPKGQGKCITFSAVVQAVNREFFSSLNEELVLESSFGLSDKPIPGDVQPILDNKPKVKYASANFSTGCNGTCHPDLSIEAVLDSNEVKLGGSSEIVVNLRISNTGDQSHSTQITIYTSNNTEYIGYLQPQNEPPEYVVVCQNVIDINNISRVQCELKNALYQQQRAIVSVRFLVSRSLLIMKGQTLDNFDQHINFRIKVQSTSPDKDMSDNVKTLTATVILHSSVELSGISNPDQLQVSEEPDGVLQFTHTYVVLNRGPSPLYNAVLYICLPVNNVAGESMITKEDVQVIEDSQELTWRIIRFPGETIYRPPSDKQVGPDISTTTAAQTTTRQSTTTLPNRQSIAPNRKKRETSAQLLQDPLARLRTFKEISCNTVDTDRHAIIQLDIRLLEKHEEVTFDIPVVISEKSLSFQQVSGIIYKSKGEVERRNDNRYRTTAVNTTYIQVPSEIFPTKISVEAGKINIWIIIGSCLGGLALLIIIGLLLWRCGFFKRKKKDDIQKWKRQSGYYAKRQSTRAGSTKSSNIKNVDW